MNYVVRLLSIGLIVLFGNASVRAMDPEQSYDQLAWDVTNENLERPGRLDLIEFRIPEKFKNDVNRELFTENFITCYMENYSEVFGLTEDQLRGISIEALIMLIHCSHYVALRES